MPVASETASAAAVAALGAVFGGGGLWAFLGSRSSGKVDLMKVAQAAAKEMIETLQEQCDRMEKRIGAVEAELTAVKEERHGLRNRLMAEQKLRAEAEARADAAEARCETLRGEVRQLGQRTDSLQRRLVAAGLPIDRPAFRDGDAVEVPASDPPAAA